jgi:hypothetical protein
MYSKNVGTGLGVEISYAPTMTSHGEAINSIQIIQE